MIRLAETAVALTLATALHAAGFVWIGDRLSTGAPRPPGGDDGTESVTLAALPPSMAGMLEAWDAAPQVGTGPASPEAPAPDTAPRPRATTAPPTQMTRPGVPTGPTRDSAPDLDTRPPAPTSLTDRPPAAPRLPGPRNDAPPKTAQPTPPSRPKAPTAPAPQGLAALPQVDSAPQAPRFAPASSERPQARPAPEPAAPATAQPRQPQQPTSAGRAAQTARGTETAPEGASAAQIADAKARWNGQVRQRIARAQRYPRGTRASGTVVVNLQVTRQGRVAGATVARSSGDAALDRAALRAVQGARLPAAPPELTDPVHHFQIPLAFRR